MSYILKTKTNKTDRLYIEISVTLFRDWTGMNIGDWDSYPGRGQMFSRHLESSQIAHNPKSKGGALEWVWEAFQWYTSCDLFHSSFSPTNIKRNGRFFLVENFHWYLFLRNGFLKRKGISVIWGRPVFQTEWNFAPFLECY